MRLQKCVVQNVTTVHFGNCKSKYDVSETADRVARLKVEHVVLHNHHNDKPSAQRS